MKKTTLTITLAVLCLFFKADAQTITRLSGRVISSADKHPVAGATIKIKNTNTSTVTNQAGEFNISSQKSQGQLTIAFTGMQSTEINFSQSRDNITVTLTGEENGLNEVQIIGYGQTTRKLNTGSVSVITAKQIEQQPVTNVLSALSGRMPGVFVQTTNGLPGGNINIQIRGKGSIAAGTDPLYIIDGVPYQGGSPNTVNNPLNADNISGSISPLNNINPDDIASITILKDADATSIYGSRGGNGVILVTTKKAYTGQTTLDINLKEGLSSIASKPKLMNLQEYLQMRREAFKTDGLTPSSDPNSAAYAPDLTLWSQEQGTDWVDYIFGNTARSTDLQARVSGGKSNTTFSISGNYRDETTVLKGNNSFKRSGIYSQLQHKSENNKFNLSLSSQLSNQNSDLVNPIQNIATIIQIAPNYPLSLPNGEPNWYSGTNIDAEINSRSKNKANNVITNAQLSYSLIENLNVKINGGYTRTTYDQTQFFPKRAISPYNINYTNFGGNQTESYLFEPQADYIIKIKNTTLNFLVGSTLQNRNTESDFIRGSNYKLESLMEDLGSAGSIDARSNSSIKYKYFSLFGRVTLNIDDTYLLNATVRKDGSSRFGEGNRFGNFGSLAGAWIFSNSSFIKEKASFINHGKLRASYGTTGNDQIPDYGYLSTYNSSGSNYQDVATLKPSRINNADFHWETTRKLDMALELGLLNDRIFISADYFLNRSQDQLVNYTLPLITGFSSYQANLPAVIENKGWELSAEVKIIEAKKFRWGFNFNITLPKNRLKSFDNFESSSYSNQYELGYDITRIYGYRFLGLNAETRLPQYADRNGAPTDNPYFFNTLGKLTPDYYGGVGNNFSMGNFELNIFFQFVRQQDRGELQYNPGIFVYNHYRYLTDRWSPENPNSENLRATANGFDPYYSNSSINIFDTSYLRIKNVSATYRVPPDFLRKLHLESLKFFCEAQNLFTWRKQNTAVMDPESGPLSNSTSGSRNTPPLKTIVFGLQFNL